MCRHSKYPTKEIKSVNPCEILHYNADILKQRHSPGKGRHILRLKAPVLYALVHPIHCVRVATFAPRTMTLISRRVSLFGITLVDYR